MAEEKRMDKIVALCKRRGFLFQSSEIYGGINGFWDYGPLGAELKRNVKDLWWRSMTQERGDVVGLEATIIMHPKIWEASGHTSTFSDPMVDCLASGKRFRSDQVEPVSGTVYKFQGAYEEETASRLFEEAAAVMPEVRGLWEAHKSRGETLWNLAHALKENASTAYQRLGEDLSRAMDSGKT